MPRRQFVLGGAGAALSLAACQPAPSQGLAHVSGSFAGASAERGHRLPGAPKSGLPPAPTTTRRVHTLIAGGGVAGLAAARALRLAGHDDFALLELEDEAGGNARATVLGGLACPQGAHYLPVPGPHNPDLQALLAELGLLRQLHGRWRPDERHLCHSPQERLHLNGHWQAGLLPTDGVGADALAQYRRFAALVAEAQRGSRYQIPHTFHAQNGILSLEQQALDAVVFDDWLQNQGLTDPHLRWFLDYCCRDDYGAGTATVSAWAGVHYFAARHGFRAPGPDADAPVHSSDEPDAVFTWPEGNAWLTRRMAQPLGDRLHTGRVVWRVEAAKHGVMVDALHPASGQTERWLARRCIVALPIGVAARVLTSPPPALQAAARLMRHAPWVVTNLHLSHPLTDRGGAAPAWDNVVHGSAGLGYVDATHQALHMPPGAPTVLTHYRALGDVADARAQLLARPWQHWLQTAVDELHPAHPELASRITQASVARYGHAMAIPTPGFIEKISPFRFSVWNSLLQKQSFLGFAHSDWAGYSVFEEAFAMGHAVGTAVVGRGVRA